MSRIPPLLHMFCTTPMVTTDRREFGKREELVIPLMVGDPDSQVYRRLAHSAEIYCDSGRNPHFVPDEDTYFFSGVDEKKSPFLPECCGLFPWLNQTQEGTFTFFRTAENQKVDLLWTPFQDNNMEPTWRFLKDGNYIDLSRQWTQRLFSGPFLVQMRMEEFLFIVAERGLSSRGVLPGSFLFCKNKRGDLFVVPTGSPLHVMSMYQDQRTLLPDIPRKELVPGGLYVSRNGQASVFVGHTRYEKKLSTLWIELGQILDHFLFVDTLPPEEFQRLTDEYHKRTWVTLKKTYSVVDCKSVMDLNSPVHGICYNYHQWTKEESKKHLDPLGISIFD